MADARNAARRIVFTGAAGAVYVQIFQYIDPGIAFGPHVSVEALVGAIVGGLGSLWGPVLGALALHTLADLTRKVAKARSMRGTRLLTLLIPCLDD